MGELNYIDGTEEIVTGISLAAGTTPTMEGYVPTIIFTFRRADGSELTPIFLISEPERMESLPSMMAVVANSALIAAQSTNN